MNNAAGEVLCVMGRVMQDLIKTGAEGNALQAKLILTEGNMAAAEATCTMKAGLEQAAGQAISGGFDILSGELGMMGGAVDLYQNGKQLSELSALDQQYQEGRAALLGRPGEEPAMGAARADGRMSDGQLEFEQNKINAKWKSYATMSQMFSQSLSTLGHGIGSLIQ